MKMINALGFLACGDLMFFLPALLPAYFPPNARLGSNTSALWLELMGVVNNVVGVGLVTSMASGLLAGWLVSRPVKTPSVAPAPGRMLWPALEGYAHPAVEEAHRRIAA
jgi:hypothetical protein